MTADSRNVPFWGILGWVLAVLSGFLLGWMGGRNGFPDPWQAIAVLVAICGMFGSLICVALSDDSSVQRELRK